MPRRAGKRVDAMPNLCVMSRLPTLARYGGDLTTEGAVRTGRRLGTSLVAAAVALALAPAAAAAGAPSGHRGHHPVGVHRAGGYPDLFARAGHSHRAIRARLDAAWNQLFHGDPGTAPTHNDGQTLYYQLTPDTAYVEDIGNQDVRTEGMGYAMMIAVQTGHQHEFDSLWN